MVFRQGELSGFVIHLGNSWLNMRLLPKKLHKQVIKNVAGCRDTRTAKSKETRGMIEHNSEVYNPPYISFFIVHVYMEEDLCRGGCILHCYVRSSLLFPYFLPFWYPYILLHF